MKTYSSAIPMAFMLLVCLLVLIPTESIAQLKKMSAEDLTNESSAILHGKCTKVKSEWNNDKDIIYTTVTVVAEEYIKGDLGPEAQLTIPGGQVGDIIYEVSEMPVFYEGEEVIAFVWKHPSGKNLITGGSQGKLKIRKDKNTGKKMVDGIPVVTTEASAKKGASVDEAPGSKRMLLEDFTQKVKGYLK